MARTPGEQFGTFELIRTLGAGGMGEVCLARDLTLDRTVALKFLPQDVTRDPDRVSRFRREARAASALNHPNLCTVFALGEAGDGQHYLAMEYVDGETLRQRLERGPLPLTEVLDIAIQLASGLTAAHASGVVHRDLKPENVMLRRSSAVLTRRSGGSPWPRTRDIPRIPDSRTITISRPCAATLSSSDCWHDYGRIISAGRRCLDSAVIGTSVPSS